MCKWTDGPHCWTSTIPTDAIPQTLLQQASTLGVAGQRAYEGQGFVSGFRSSKLCVLIILHQRRHLLALRLRDALDLSHELIVQLLHSLLVPCTLVLGTSLLLRLLKHIQRLRPEGAPLESENSESRARLPQ